MVWLQRTRRRPVYWRRPGRSPQFALHGGPDFGLWTLEFGLRPELRMARRQPPRQQGGPPPMRPQAAAAAMRPPGDVPKLVAEFIGTFGLIFMGGGAILAN